MQEPKEPVGGGVPDERGPEGTGSGGPEGRGRDGLDGLNGSGALDGSDGSGRDGVGPGGPEQSGTGPEQSGTGPEQSGIGSGQSGTGPDRPAGNGTGPAGPQPLGVAVTPTGDAAVDAQLRRLADADHLAASGHLEVYEDVHRGLRDALAALDRRPGPAGPSGAAPSPQPSATYDNRS